MAPRGRWSAWPEFIPPGAAPRDGAMGGWILGPGASARPLTLADARAGGGPVRSRGPIHGRAARSPSSRTIPHIIGIPRVPWYALYTQANPPDLPITHAPRSTKSLLQTESPAGCGHPEDKPE